VAVWLERHGFDFGPRGPHSQRDLSLGFLAFFLAMGVCAWAGVARPAGASAQARARRVAVKMGRTTASEASNSARA
jgi:hypothetical protein